MFVDSVNNSSSENEQVIRQKYLVVDDEIVKNEVDQEDFILDIGVDKDLALFASNYEEALKIINLHSDIAICFVDSKIPKNERDLYNFEANIQNDSSEWGISLIPEINRLRKHATIVVYSAYVTKTYLKTKVKQFSNIKGFFGKPGGIKHRKKLYLEAIGTDPLNPEKNLENPTKTNATSNQPVGFDYSALDPDLSIYLREKTVGLQNLIKRSTRDLIDIGRSLIEVKNKLEHGQFYLWLETEFSWTYRTANRFMNVAEKFEPEQLLDLNILPSALYELSAPSIPEAAREEALSRAEQGEKINLDVVKEIKNKYSPRKDNILLTDKSITVEKLTEDLALRQDKVQDSDLQNKRQEILKVVPRQNLFLLGKHLLFCGDPNSERFIKHLPSKISLNLAFPTQKNWFFSFDRDRSEVSFRSQYFRDLDLQLLLEAVERYIKITTDGGDNITICFIPHPEILLLAHRLDCRCFISEPDRNKCEAVIAAWKEFEAKNQ